MEKKNLNEVIEEGLIKAVEIIFGVDSMTKPVEWKLTKVKEIIELSSKLNNKVSTPNEKLIWSPTSYWPQWKYQIPEIESKISEIPTIFKLQPKCKCQEKNQEKE